jgi:hypothetical protein
MCDNEDSHCTGKNATTYCNRFCKPISEVLKGASIYMICAITMDDVLLYALRLALQDSFQSFSKFWQAGSGSSCACSAERMITYHRRVSADRLAAFLWVRGDFVVWVWFMPILGARRPTHYWPWGMEWIAGKRERRVSWCGIGRALVSETRSQRLPPGLHAYP